jgi:hypothetical protein
MENRKTQLEILMNAVREEIEEQRRKEQEEQ